MATNEHINLAKATMGPFKTCHMVMDDVSKDPSMNLIAAKPYFNSQAFLRWHLQFEVAT